jgi:hypothetical protein
MTERAVGRSQPDPVHTKPHSHSGTIGGCITKPLITGLKISVADEREVRFGIKLNQHQLVLG